jgi:nucleotide-binding universal stress UspA family protein
MDRAPAALPQRLLLATEATPFDVGAHRLALALAAHWNRVLPVVVPLVSTPEFEASAPDQAARADEAAHQRLEPLRADARAAGVALALEVRRGTALEDEVLAAAQAPPCDLLVVRRRGEPGWLARLRVGARVERLVSRAHCPVLVCPRDAQRPVRGLRLMLEVGAGLLPASAPSLSPVPAPRVPAVLAVAASLSLPVTAVVVDEAGDRRPQTGLQGLTTALQELARTAGCHLTVETPRSASTAPDPWTDAGTADLLVVWRTSRPGRDPSLSAVLGHARCAVWVEPPRPR